MSRAAGIALALTALACAGRSPSTAPALDAGSATSFDPVASDRALLRDRCLGCHSAELIAQQRLTATQWAKVIEKMQRWGAPLEGDDAQALAAHVAPAGVAAGDPYRPATIGAAEARALFSRLPDGPLGGGDPAKGRALYAERCEPCHGAAGAGTPLGFTLAGRQVLDRAPEFAQVVRVGRAAMPADPEATDGDLADLLAYLRAPAP